MPSKAFNAPVKSPFNTDEAKTPQNVHLLETPKAPKKKLKATSNEIDLSVSKTMNFKLYESHSNTYATCNYTNRISTPNNSIFSFSQSTTPGCTPGQIVPNIRDKIKNLSPIKNPSSENECDMSWVREAHRRLFEAGNRDESPKVIPDIEKNEFQTPTKSIYDLKVSPHNNKKHQTHSKPTAQKETTKQQVLKMLRRTRVELKELRTQHEKILKDIRTSKQAEQKQTQSDIRQNGTCQLSHNFDITTTFSNPNSPYQEKQTSDTFQFFLPSKEENSNDSQTEE